MVPESAAAMPNRPLLRMFMATLNPPPTSPSTHSAGTRTFSKNTSAVFEALMPIFFSGGPLDQDTESKKKKQEGEMTKANYASSAKAEQIVLLLVFLRKKMQFVQDGQCHAFPVSCLPGRAKSSSTHCVTPPKLFSTIKAVILSFTSPVFSSFTGVLANTVKISARPPLLQQDKGEEKKKKKTLYMQNYTHKMQYL